MRVDSSPPDRNEGTWIGNWRVPFPFDFLLGLAFLPVLLIAGLVSIPLAPLHRARERKRESVVAQNLTARGRVVAWAEAKTFIECGHGTLIGEYSTLKGPYRLWWTEDDIVAITPYPPCRDVLPWEHDSQEFFAWCRERYTDLEMGRASWVDLTGLPEQEMEAAFQKLKPLGRWVCMAEPRLFS
jgi:hypothetical protein